jgi:NAD(P)-dependent dehydrogenase (short-subunit alcohol dehydrogenase family)
VNAVAPGVIETDISNLRKTETGRNLTPGMQSLKRIGEQEDLADVIAFLSSDRARWITGVRIPWTVVQSARPKHQPGGPNVHWM